MYFSYFCFSINSVTTITNTSMITPSMTEVAPSVPMTATQERFSPLTEVSLKYSTIGEVELEKFKEFSRFVTRANTKTNISCTFLLILLYIV